MKRVLLTATVQSHIVQFHKPLIDVLHNAGYEVHVAAKDNLAEKNGLKLDFVERVFDVPFSRSPRSSDNIKAYRRLKDIIETEHYDIIHCNTPMGGIVTRLAAKKVRKNGTLVFYTAHGFHFYQGAPIKNWIIYYPIEKYMALLCDKVITIAKEDYRIAKRKFKTQVCHIHGVGVDSGRYHSFNKQEVMALREKMNLKPDDFCVLCIGELNDNKNQIVLLKSISKLVDRYPNIRVLLAGNGPKELLLKKYISSNGLSNNVSMLGYRTDLETITPAIDLLVSCSKREGLGLNVIEAMLCKKPVIVSINRGHKELVRDTTNGFLFLPTDTETLSEKIEWMINHESERNQMGAIGYKVAHHYNFEAVKKELKDIYELS